MNQRNLSHEETLSGLQKELKHCLARNRSKREEVQQLRAQLDVMKRDLANKENERQRLEIIVRKQEVRDYTFENDHNLINFLKVLLEERFFASRLSSSCMK